MFHIDSQGPPFYTAALFLFQREYGFLKVEVIEMNLPTRGEIFDYECLVGEICIDPIPELDKQSGAILACLIQSHAYGLVDHYDWIVKVCQLRVINKTGEDMLDTLIERYPFTPAVTRRSLRAEIIVKGTGIVLLRLNESIASLDSGEKLLSLDTFSEYSVMEGLYMLGLAFSLSPVQFFRCLEEVL